jgi:hypothetical protein
MNDPNPKIEQMKQQWNDGCATTSEVLRTILLEGGGPLSVLAEIAVFTQDLVALEEAEAERFRQEAGLDWDSEGNWVGNVRNENGWTP